MSEACVRVWYLAGNTVREAVRQRLVHFLVLLSAVLVLGARWLRTFDFGAPELKFLADCGFGAIALFGAALTITMTAQLFFAEIESRTVLTLLAKPVRRAEFILGKFLGVAALMAVFCTLLTGLLVAVLAARERQLAVEAGNAVPPAALVDYGCIVVAGLLQWLKFNLLAAYVLLVASFARTQLFAVITGFLVLVICQLQALAHDVYARAATVGARATGAVLGSVFPNFQLFDLVEMIGISSPPPLMPVLRIVGYAALYLVTVLALAGYSFQRREI